MAKRKHISDKTKLASALLALREISYDDAKKMGEANFLSLWTFDHGILHGIEVVDDYWNLTPRLIKPHREKSAKDRGIVAKTKRLEKAHVEHKERMTTSRFLMASGAKPKPYQWPKRKIQNKGFTKAHRPMRGPQLTVVEIKKAER